MPLSIKIQNKSSKCSSNFEKSMTIRLICHWNIYTHLFHWIGDTYSYISGDFLLSQIAFDPLDFGDDSEELRRCSLPNTMICYETCNCHDPIYTWSLPHFPDISIVVHPDALNDSTISLSLVTSCWHTIVNENLALHWEAMWSKVFLEWTDYSPNSETYNYQSFKLDFCMYNIPPGHIKLSISPGCRFRFQFNIQLQNSIQYSRSEF